MSLDDRNKLNRLEELKSKLFSKDYKTKIEHRDGFSHLERPEAVETWNTEDKTDENTGEKFFMKTSLFKKFFIFSIVFFILALLYGGYVFFIGGNTVSNDNIDISVTGNNFTAGGEVLPLIVGITNRNSSPLQLVDLVVAYPKGSSSDLASDMEKTRESIGTIPSGAVHNENLNLTLFGEQGSTKTIKISIEYRVAGSNAIFVKEKDYNVTINSTPINLSVDAPTTVSPNQNITLNIKATLNATKQASKILVQVDYPIGFTFVSAVPAPSSGNNVWNLGNLAPGAEHDIAITGKMVGVFDGDQKTFNVSTGSQSSANNSAIDVVYNSIQNTISIQKPFVEANILIDGVAASSYATDSKTPVDVQINYANNLDTKVDDLVVQAKLTGNAFDRKTINGQQGFYDSAEDMITWDKSSVSQLAEVNPGDSGTLNFSFSPLSLFSASGGILADPTVNVEIDISGSQAVSGFATTQLSNSTSATINVISDVGFSTKGLYYSGAFTNTGPIPPKVGKTTTYTVVWTLSNTSNSISNVQVSSTLPLWTNFVGPISSTDENLTYNASTKEIDWNAERIPRGAGVTTDPVSVSFQVSFTPSLSQVGTIPTIINGATLTGHDDFANVDVKVNKSALNARLENDPAFPPTGGTVTN